MNLTSKIYQISHGIKLQHFFRNKKIKSNSYNNKKAVLLQILTYKNIREICIAKKASRNSQIVQFRLVVIVVGYFRFCQLSLSFTL